MDDRRLSIDRRGGDRRHGDDRREIDRRYELALARRGGGVSGVSGASGVSDAGRCLGACVLCDTRACAGRCAGCRVEAAELCAGHLLCSERGRLQMAQAGNSDYRSMAALFIRRLGDDDGGAHDRRFQEQIERDERRHRRYLEQIERQRIEAAHGSVARASGLAALLPETAMQDILALFPGIDNNTARFEVQLFIYMFHNHRHDIDVNHASSRFLVPQAVINRSLRTYFGVAYPTLLSIIRNEHSKRYLDVARLRVNEAGELAGYRNPGNFSVSFKRIEGRSPKDYRAKLYREGGLRGGDSS